MCGDGVVRDSDHDAVLGSHAVIRRPDTYTGPMRREVLEPLFKSSLPPSNPISSPDLPSL